MSEVTITSNSVIQFPAISCLPPKSTYFHLTSIDQIPFKKSKFNIRKAEEPLQQGLFILDIGGMGTFLRAHFLKKGIFFACTPKQMSFLTISYENIFSKTQDTRLGAIVASNKGLK